MAETKTRPKKAKPKAKKPQAKRSRPGKAKASSTNRAKSKPSPTSGPKAALEAVEETAKDAGGTVAKAASKAKVPLIAGGAALAGVAGGAALGARQANRHHLHRGLAGVDSDGLAKAAKKVGSLGVQVGELALEGRRARAASNGRTHRSPIEVVLQGLTSRHSRN